MDRVKHLDSPDAEGTFHILRLKREGGGGVSES